MAGAVKLWGGNFDIKTDLLLAYLPLAHILEQVRRSGGDKVSRLHAHP